MSDFRDCLNKQLQNPEFAAAYAEIEKEMMTDSHNIGFVQGVVYVLARLIECFDEPSMAMDIFRQSGLKISDLRVASEYDLKFLRKEKRGIPKGIE